MNVVLTCTLIHQRRVSLYYSAYLVSVLSIVASPTLLFQTAENDVPSLFAMLRLHGRVLLNKHLTEDMQFVLRVVATKQVIVFSKHRGMWLY